MVKMDITNIEYPDETFDFVICNHVLEHVIDDVKAMREFKRVLKPDGRAVFMVPVIRKKTEEDFTINTPEGRLKAYGQGDHVRAYGKDFIDRLRSAGFMVETVRAADLLTEAKIQRYNCNDTLYCCEKET
jgi:ubiquinone/menaquinone biosynthesis C-methylase UbiE